MSSPPPAKRVRFAEALTDEAPEPAPHRRAATSRHSLDSDEDEGDEAATGGDADDRLRDEDIEGQEEATIANDDGIAITPFNMREEMREGYFDSAGCYIFKKEEKEVHDSWLESVDWETVKRKAATASSASATASKDEDTDKDHDDEENSEKGIGGSDSDSDADDLGPSQLAGLCSAARDHLLPGETVAGAIKRLGGGTNRALSASQRLRLKKAGGAVAAANASAEAAANRERMLALSELAGRLVSAGHMTAYQMDATQLTRLGGISDAEASASAASAGGSSGMNMFAADVADKDQSEETKTEIKDSDMDESGVLWYYRVADEPSAELMGPFSSQRMLQWAESDTGWPGGHRTVFVRKRDAASDAPFYSSARIDFDLYV